MDKISSIINSSRNKVDMSKERPVRAGAPSYGRPVSEASQTFQKLQREEELMNVNQKVTPEVARHSGIIDKITFSFRGNSERPEKTVEQVVDLSGLSPEELNLESTGGTELVEVAPEQTEGESQGLDLYA